MVKTNKLSTHDMEASLMQYFNVRTNIIVPNVSWGLFLHECDLLVLTPSGYATEVEIKIDKYDLIRDKNKSHKHASKKIKNFYFAIPDYLLDYQSHIPERAGIVVVDPETHRSKRIRYPQPQGNYKWSQQEIFKLTRLGTMRIQKERETAAYWKRQFDTLNRNVVTHDLRLTNPSD